MLRSKKFTKTQRAVVSRRKAAVKKARAPHKRVLLHPFSIFFLLCVGVILATMTLHVFADDITITGQKLAPIPTQPIIMSTVTPISESGSQGAAQSTSNNSITTTQPLILIQGTCPKDTYIKFYRNDVFAGAAMCIGDPTFSITIGLDKGMNNIVGHVFSLTDGEGPQSITLSVLYSANDQAADTAITSNTNLAENPEASPFFLTSDFRFHGVFIGKEFSWEMVSHGKSTPFTYSIDWGDKTNETINQSKAGKLTLVHKYESPGGYNGNYAVKVKAKDSAGNLAFLQLLAVVNGRQEVLCAHVIDNSSCTVPFGLIEKDHHKPKTILSMFWSAYAIVLLMTISFWLGERELIYQGIIPRTRRRRHA